MIPDRAGIATIFGRTRMIKSFTFIPHPGENRLEGYMCSPEGFRLGEWEYPTTFSRILLSSLSVRTGYGFQIGQLNMKQAIDTDPYLLPADLPVPVDDGACRHLRAMKVPSISLRSTSGRDVNLASASSG